MTENAMIKDGLISGLKIEEIAHSLGYDSCVIDNIIKADKELSKLYKAPPKPKEVRTSLTGSTIELVQAMKINGHTDEEIAKNVFNCSVERLHELRDSNTDLMFALEINEQRNLANLTKAYIKSIMPHKKVKKFYKYIREYDDEGKVIRDDKGKIVTEKVLDREEVEQSIGNSAEMFRLLQAKLPQTFNIVERVKEIEKLQLLNDNTDGYIDYGTIEESAALKYLSESTNYTVGKEEDLISEQC